jgi:hypothetical protein
MSTTQFDKFESGEAQSNSGNEAPGNVYASLAALCWAPKQFPSAVDNGQTPERSLQAVGETVMSGIGEVLVGGVGAAISRVGEKSLQRRVADAYPAIPGEDIDKLSEGIAASLAENRNLEGVMGKTFGYSSAMQHAWSQGGQKGLDQLVDKINKDLKDRGSDLRLENVKTNLVMEATGRQSLHARFVLNDAKGDRVDESFTKMIPFAQRNLSRDKVDDGVSLIADIAKSGKLSEPQVSQYVKDFFRSAMNNGNLAEVTKKVNAELAKANSPYRIDTGVTTVEQRSDKFGQFDHKRTDTVKVKLTGVREASNVYDTVSDTTYMFGVINNNIDLGDRELPRFPR